MTAAPAPDGQPRTTDPRVTAAVALLAENHQFSALPAARLRTLLASYDGRLRALLELVSTAAKPRERFRQLQALEDAILYRSGRAAAPCPDCDLAPSGQCDDHGRDTDLIGEYHQVALRLGAGQPLTARAAPGHGSQGPRARR